MGCIRLVLALVVVAFHMGAFPGYLGMDGGAAVRFFFMISGFYMAMILNEKYVGRTGEQYRAFLKSRFLRIYPLYFLILALSLLASLGIGRHSLAGDLLYIPNYTDRGILGLPAWLAFTAANLGLVGISILSFYAYVGPGGGLHWAGDVYSMPNPGFRFFPVPQAWSLDLEIVFYCLAPLFIRDTRKVLVLAALSFGVNALFWLHVFGERTLYDLFPAQLWIFCLGALAYTRYRKIAAAPPRRPLMVAALAGVLALAAFYQLFPGVTGDLFCLGVMFLCLPYVFRLTKRVRWDRAIGELSYPVYLCHFLVLSVLEALTGAPVAGAMKLAALALVLGLSTLLYLAVARPLDAFRHRLAPGVAAG